LLTLLSASGAYADGAYQRTEDRKKTFVWNNDPQPGDAATWSGDRDQDGYASGPGTLRWFKIERGFLTGSNVAGRKRTPISSYSGTMEHGKFNGGVTTVDHGKTYHATFTDGQKKGRWTAGPLIAKAESAEAATVVKKAERAAPETSTEVTSESRKTEKASEEKAQASVGGDTEDVPAQGPAEEKAEVRDQKSEITKSEVANEEKPKASQPLIAQASTEEPDQSSTPRAPATRKAALQPGAVRAIERSTGGVTKKSEGETVRRAERAKAGSGDAPSKITKPASSQPPKGDIELNENIPAEGPAPTGAEKSEPDAHLASSSKSAKAAPPAKKETPADNSIRTLTGPPSSLHVNAPPPETNPPMQISTPPTAAVSSPPATGPKLTAVQAMDIADIEARTKGYDLGEYQLPKAEYNAASDTWSVGYVAREGDKTDKKLSVTIQDKSGKAEVKK
jgi:hypothetical protein